MPVLKFKIEKLLSIDLVIRFFFIVDD